mmetsp:Transcript_16060/g.22160  ORF Transcript_16060/g.22160 Transcript_16060/m.22160 type:complete len:309 (+) Transcript_16060:67-993(+)|eukprot:CAMPEP_0196581660 /NCGR_PEP_ID=MMETSP1081-20130531/34873_1 /TAXON_ID=36882 /ORGANISM="Pyramimonas amylifera, Strain CCMP720" /LENGTH=308 /DNA_ID=CAMNT_0041901975 /DNA_START=42 /DNA_END=968 /DNA_ORIENTATION=-
MLFVCSQQVSLNHAQKFVRNNKKDFEVSRSSVLPGVQLHSTVNLRENGRTRRITVCSTYTSDVAGPKGAFESETLSDTRMNLFNTISPVYDQMNDLLSLGLHRVWKRAAVKWSGASAGDSVLDVCCGTGDLTFRLAQVVGPTGQATGLDFAASTLVEGARREAALPAAWTRPKMQWVEGDALDLPFPDHSFHAITLGYGLRNVADIPLCLRELHRVLKPGSTVVVLDFNRPEDPGMMEFQSFVLDNVVVPVARLNGVEDEYAYLKPSIARFPTGREQEMLAKNAGFVKAVHYDLSPGGLMGCLVATKG